MNNTTRVLAFDCGNSRLKWGLYENGVWTQVGMFARDEIGQLGAVLATLPQPDRVAVANVAGAGFRAVLEAQLQGIKAQAQWLVSQAAQCAVVNLYTKPATLGVDRWCALMGARQHHAGPCVVVCAGTATTVDLLSGQGDFLGGLILPGIELMKRSLAENTAALPLAEGMFLDQPRSTEDAIESGVLHAQAGAVERMVARLGAQSGAPAHGVACLLSGGSAARLAQALAIPHRVLDHLVLEGVARIALATP